MNPKYLNNWGDEQDMIRDFELREGCLKGVEILLASYSTYSYEGYAFVLFRRNGKFYEVNASHCSCYGLENQWDPEETTVDALRYRLDKGRLGDYHEHAFATELRAILDALEDEKVVSDGGVA